MGKKDFDLENYSIIHKEIDFWLQDLPENGEARIQAIKDQVFSMLSEAVVASMKHLIYGRGGNYSKVFSREDAKKLFSLDVYYYLADSTTGRLVVQLFPEEKLPPYEMEVE